jgi:hypothetical protein
MDATPEGGSCSIRAADYDQSCTSDSDCVGVHEGTSCACTNCINAAIGTTSESEYNSAFVRAFPNSGDCPCAAPPPAYCNNGDCAVCLSGSCGQPPSCATGGPGMTNCGPGGSGTESCCTSLEVTGGTYYRTYDLDSNGNAVLVPDGGPTGEADPATVSTLRLDKYEVTVGRFRQFVTAWSTGWLPAAGSGKHTHVNSGNGLNATGGGYEPGWGAPDDVWIAPTSANLASAPGQGGGGCDGPGTWTPSVGSHENLPINCENWYEAYAFCIWDGGFLPSEAEWEYAAAGEPAAGVPVGLDREPPISTRSTVATSRAGRCAAARRASRPWGRLRSELGSSARSQATSLNGTSTGPPASCRSTSTVRIVLISFPRAPATAGAVAGFSGRPLRTTWSPRTQEGRTRTAAISAAASAAPALPDARIEDCAARRDRCGRSIRSWLTVAPCAGGDFPAIRVSGPRHAVCCAEGR